MRPIRLPSRLAVPCLVSLVCGSCFFVGDDVVLAPRLDLAQARDLAAPVPDQSVGDLAPPPDLTVADLFTPADQSIVDLTPGDALPCQGGYLNSNAPNACPLPCSPDVRPVPDEGAFHLPFCTQHKYMHNPPATGDHWGFPAPWGIFTDIVPREWWVHNLEHQGIVLLYNCPYPKADGGKPQMAKVLAAENCVGDGGFTYPQELERVDNCANEIAQFAQMYANHPLDNFWDAIFEVRMIVTQDPLLPARFAAVAWDWVWMSNQFDAKAIQCFIDSRYGRGPEEAP